MPWIRIDTEIDDSARFDDLSGIGRAIYLWVLRRAKKNGGSMSDHNWRPDFIARRTGFEAFGEEVRLAMTALTEPGGLLEVSDGQVWVDGWEKYQIDPTATERQRKRRGAKKDNDNPVAVTDVTVTGRESQCQAVTSVSHGYRTIQDNTGQDERDIFLVPEVENDKTSKDKVQSDKTSKVEKNLFDLGLNSIPTTYDEGYDNRIYPTYQGKADTLSKKVAEIITDLFDEWPQEAVEYSVKNWMYTHRDLTLEEWGKIAREARNVTKHGEIDRQIIKNINAKINTWKINRNEKKTNRVAQAPPCPGYDKEGRWTPRGKVGDREYRMTWWYDDANCNARRNMDIFLEQSPRSRPYLPQEGIDLLNRLIDEHEAAGHPWKIEVGDD